MNSLRRQRIAELIFCVMLLAMSYTVRVLPLTWGQPDPAYATSFHSRGMIHEQTPLHPDEYFFTAVPFRKVLEPQSNFAFYENPSFLVNVSYVISRLSGIGSGLNPADRSGLNERYYAPFSVYIITRLLSILGGMISVAAAYGIARMLGGARAAMVAGLLTALMLPLVAHTHYGTTSSLATGFATLAVFLSASAVISRHFSSARWLLILTGIAAGLAMGNRYNAAVVSICLLGAGVWWLWQLRRSIRWWHIFTVIAAWCAFPLTFLLTTPGAITDTQEFLEQIRYVSNMYLGTGISTNLNVDRWVGLLIQCGFVVLYGLGSIASVLGIIGMAWLLRSQWHNRFITCLMIVFVVLYALLVMRTVRPLGADHLTLPVLPILAVLSGVGAAAISSRWPLLLRVGLVAVILAFPVYLTLTHLRIITIPDNRELMQRWIYDHVPAGSTFTLVGSINVALDPADYPWRHLFTLPERIDWNTERLPDFLLLSNAYPDQFRKMGIEPLENLPEGAELVAIVNKPPRLGNEHPVFTSDYFHSPTIRLYCLNVTACDATIRAR